MLIEALNLGKVYTGFSEPLSVLVDVSLNLNEGETIGIYGTSGAGKSTLLHIIGGLDSPDNGKVSFNGEDIFGMTEAKLAKFRNLEMGFVFQFYHLLPEFNALENVMIPGMIAGQERDIVEEKAMESLKSVGLGARMRHRPAELSGGEQQRVALARAAVMNPKLLLADEPTGNLDRKSGEEVWGYLKKMQEERGMAMIVVSHNLALIESLPKKHELIDGKLK